MKSRFSLGIILLGFLVFVSCNKDIHEKYVGDYLVHEHIYSYGSEYCGEHFSFEKDTIITVLPGNTKKKIIVLGREVELNDDGEFTDYSSTDYFLSIRNDSIMSYEKFGGNECGRYEKYNGNKITD